MRRLEIVEAVDAGSRAIKARGIDPEIFNVAARSPRAGRVLLPEASGPPQVIALDLPPLRDESEPPLQYFAVHASPWPGGVAVWRSADGESYERIALAQLCATVGVTLDPLPAGPVARWDHANSFRVKLASGALASMSDLRVLGGANAAAVRNPDGGWEVIQFAQAELVAANTYRLSRLLRGQQGSDAAMLHEHESGADFVLLNEALVPVSRAVGELGLSFRYRVGPSSQDVGSTLMTEMQAAIGASALLPWRPVHAVARRDEDGVLLSWIRRSRIGGDSWDAAEVPLGEAEERYRLDILGGTDTLRTLEAGAPHVLYAAADEIADFGAAQASLSIRLAQLSAVAGPGHALRVTLPVES